MSGELEAAGALATAGAVAGVIEGREGGPPGEGACLNCGAQLNGPFCAQCGQNARPLRKLSQLLSELLHSLFHFDTKAWRTLPMVLFRPGTLTRDYTFGKRARYISPLATFLLCVFALFFVFSSFGGAEFGRGLEDAMVVSQEDVEEARQGVAEARAALAEVQANPSEHQPGAIGLASGALARAEGRLTQLEAQYAAQERREAEQGAETAPPDPDTANPPATDAADPPVAEAPASAEETGDVYVGVTIDDEEVARRIESGETRWQDELAEAARNGDININLGHPYLNERALATLSNPDLALYRIQEAASKFSFLLAPLSLPFIALLFLWKRGITFYDHIVYALYALSFAAILFITLIVGGALFGSNAVAMMSLSNVLLFGALPVHTFFQLKGGYALGWWSALWRAFFMLFFTIIIATIFLLLVLILGLAG